jgi:hypothetical protein
MHAKESWSAKHSLGPPQDRRRTPRQQAKGVVFLTLRDSDSSEIPGFLLDVSASGFRAAHRFKELCSGQEVVFSHDGGAGVARVVWTRILGQTVESGFLVYPTEERKRIGADRSA